MNKFDFWERVKDEIRDSNSQMQACLATKIVSCDDKFLFAIVDELHRIGCKVELPKHLQERRKT